MKYAVTGANGLIGRAVVRQLVAQGDQVTALVRTAAPAGAWPAEAVTVITGDIRDPAARQSLIAGADRVIHLAALASAWSQRIDDFTEINVAAVSGLLDDARVARVGRVVHVSTDLVLPDLKRRCLTRAETPYEATKRAGEVVARDASMRQDVVIVQPSRVLGPGPLTDSNGVTRMLGLHLRGLFRVRLADGDAIANYVDVDDVAAAILLAATAAVPGSTHLVGGENTSIRALLQRTGRLAGTERVVLPLPPIIGRGLGAAMEMLGPITGRVPLTHAWMSLLLESRPHPASASRTLAGYAPRPLDDTLRRIIAWFSTQPGAQ